MNAATLTRNLLPVFTAVLSGCCMSYHAHGAIIFDGNPTNVSLVTNGANGGDGQVSSGAASDPLFFSPIGGSNSTGFSSTDDIQTLNGGSIVATDIVTYTLTITDTEVSTTNASSPGLSFWGHEMGLASAGGAFRTNPNAFVVVDARGSSSTRTNLGYSPNNIFSQVQNSLPGTTPAGEGITADSLLDGYTIEIAYTAGGVTTVLSDVESSGTAATTVKFPTEPWPVGTDFVDYMNNAHFYVTAQGGGQFNVGAATIDVSRIPEPTSLALLGLGFFGLAARRR